MLGYLLESHKNYFHFQYPLLLNLCGISFQVIKLSWHQVGQKVGSICIPIEYLSPRQLLLKQLCALFMTGTGITVDAFQYGLVEGCTAYFLTHFHSDHYAGLSKNFTFPVYCSEVSFSILNSECMGCSKFLSNVVEKE